jgi:hypothetical protein
MTRNRFYPLAAALLVSTMLTSSGCLETRYALVEKDHATVDRGYVGDWLAGSDKVVIRNIDDHQYYVEQTAAGQKPLRLVGLIWEAKGAAFAQLRDLPADGSLADKYLVVRIERKADKITLRQLDDKFFASKSITSSADLRRVLEQNLENKDMYDGDPVTLTRQPEGEQK